MTSGVALNQGVVAALENEIGEKIVVVTDPQIVGAHGATLYVAEMANS
jgi:activator of 2-hydroxyglutaryl-CoA dehydratase